MRNPFAVIFDNDGVLVDSERFSEHAYRTALAEQGAVMAWEDGSRYCGLTDADILSDVSARCGICLDPERLTVRKWELYQEAAIRNDMQAFPGAVELLDALQGAGVPCALASSANHEKIAFNLERSGLRRRFRHIVSGEECGRGKPDPEIFLRAAQLLEVPPADCFVIEDSINGLKAARAAGAFAIGVAHTFSPEQLAPHADWVVLGLAEITAHALAECHGRSGLSGPSGLNGQGSP